MGRIGTGLDTWSPNINIFRDPRWGRGQETYGEDPFLTAHMGVAFVTGMQGPNPDLPAVVATPKHFAVHSGPESTRHSANVFVSRHDLEDTYLPAFRAAIVEGKAGSVMCAYNRIDGQPACASDELLKEHLRGAWGFDGYVVSDCDAVKDISDNHHYAPDPASAVAAAMRAGVDSECHTATLSDTAGLGDRYREALKRGLLTEADVDRTLVRLFSARYRNGDLSGVRKSAGDPASVGAPAHGAWRWRPAEKSLVLLKNDGILPLRPGLRIAVIGPLGDATRVLRGNYSSSLSAPPISVVDGPAPRDAGRPRRVCSVRRDLYRWRPDPGERAAFARRPPRPARALLQCARHAPCPLRARRDPTMCGRPNSLCDKPAASRIETSVAWPQPRSRTGLGSPPCRLDRVHRAARDGQLPAGPFGLHERHDEVPRQALCRSQGRALGQPADDEDGAARKGPPLSDRGDRRRAYRHRPASGWCGNVFPPRRSATSRRQRRTPTCSLPWSA
jgi:beta-glucosidase-like glycosyl hydrolase